MKKLVIVIAAMWVLLMMGCGDNASEKNETMPPQSKATQENDKSVQQDFNKNKDELIRETDKEVPLDNNINVTKEEKDALADIANEYDFNASEAELETIIRIYKQSGFDVTEFKGAHLEGIYLNKCVVINTISSKGYLSNLSTVINRNGDNFKIDIVPIGTNIKLNLSQESMVKWKLNEKFPPPSTELCNKIKKTIDNDINYPNTIKIKYRDGDTLTDALKYSFNSGGELYYILNIIRTCKSKSYNKESQDFHHGYIFDLNGDMIGVK